MTPTVGWAILLPTIIKNQANGGQQVTHPTGTVAPGSTRGPFCFFLAHTKMDSGFGAWMQPYVVGAHGCAERPSPERRGQLK